MATWGSTAVQVGGAYSSGATVANETATFGSAVAVGNLVVVTAVVYQTSATPYTVTLSDQEGNVYTQVVAGVVLHAISYIQHNAWMLVVPSGSGVALACKISSSTNSYIAIGISEHSFSGGTPAFDGESSNVATTTALASGSIPVTGSGPDLMIGFVEQNDFSAATLSVGTGFTSVFTSPYVSATSLGFLAEYQANVTSSQAATGTSSISTNYGMVGFSLKLIASAGSRFRRTLYDRAGSRGGC
jgi:hypothetical protein